MYSDRVSGEFSRRTPVHETIDWFISGNVFKWNIFCHILFADFYRRKPCPDSISLPMHIYRRNEAKPQYPPCLLGYCVFVETVLDQRSSVFGDEWTMAHIWDARPKQHWIGMDLHAPGRYALWCRELLDCDFRHWSIIGDLNLISSNVDMLDGLSRWWKEMKT